MDSSHPFDLTLLLAAILHRATRWVGTPHGYLCLLNPLVDKLEVVYATGLAEAHIAAHIERGEGVAGKTWATGEVQVVSLYHQWSGRVAQQRRENRPQVTSIMGVPLSLNNVVLGVMGLFVTDPERTFTPEEVDFFTRMEASAGTILNNAIHAPENPVVTYIEAFHLAVPEPP